jgi:Rrf2 family transcriptional regulator, cysteine metabolism repressor
MKLSTRTRYGMRALMDLALHNTGQPIQIKDIAERQQISLSYLEHLVIPLISAGIVKSTRGSRGGIKLAKLPQDITLKYILDILEGPLKPVECLSDEKSCSRSGMCATRDVWMDLAKAMEKVLESSTLEDLANRQKAKDSKPTSMYYI